MVDFRQVKYDPAYTLKELSIAIGRDNQNASHYFKRSQFHLEAQNYAAALKDISQAIELDENNGEYYFRKAQILRSSNSYRAALVAAARADELKYRHTDLDILLGELYLFSKDYERALGYLNTALEENPQNEYIYFYRGLAQAQTGDTLAAIRNFKIAIRRAPDLIDAYNQLIKIYLAQNEDGPALTYIRAGHRQDSVNAYLWYYQGEHYTRRQQPDSAYLSFANAIKYDSSLYLAHYKMGLLAFARRNYGVAISAMEKALPHTGHLPQMHLVLGESYEKTGQVEQALPHYQWVFSREPQNIKAMWGVRRTMYQLYKVRRDSLRNDERKKHDSLLAIFRQRQKPKTEN
ncbi:MAG: hypothetical protein AVDCRST_MAG95-2222 [uncultured Adhaeribacter sp.]|uniref:Uncharacterized protein n=1 Tax=uncultured Adhaeribacter sp. TaxID=448109 RepID=A0A6J4IQL3_9BACT|nr:MAG: hypothetical protein AVDCRST_MAG95-2222 [uncultured Adhaeribacter sp.]